MLTSLIKKYLQSPKEKYFVHFKIKNNNLGFIYYHNTFVRQHVYNISVQHFYKIFLRKNILFT